MNDKTSAPLLRLTGLRKFFASSGVLAVADVSLDVHAGEVVALVGENGTGKTTLMNLLFGALPMDAGSIEVDGEPVAIKGPEDAIRAGIGMVQQHFALVPSFTAAQNVMLGREPLKRGALDDAEAEREVGALGERLGFPIDPKKLVAALPIGLQQRVEILKALAGDTRLLILDEPTAVLTPKEADELIVSVRKLAALGTAVVFISHKLPEVLAVSDRVVVMRRGHIVDEMPTSEATPAAIARAMVGRDVLLSATVDHIAPGAPVLEVAGLDASQVSAGDSGLSDVGLTVRAGEIVGVAGVSGNGQGNLVDAIAGLRKIDAGSIKIDGVEVSGMSPRGVRRAGLAHIAEDRMHVGLNRAATLEENAVATTVFTRRFNRAGWLRRGAIHTFARKLIEQYEIRGAAPTRIIESLSGGNLQKIVIGRELEGSPKLIIANQPTRGLDVGSIEFVHRELLAARGRGAGLLLVSAELEELQRLSDRIVVLYEGRLSGPFDRGQLSTYEIGALMAGQSLSAAEADA
ncbi:ABC transporter ATP-binding protein [Amnibacterium flavum]|uniref:Heme ABC transporter ATP-binding protein n=1 Tax=Amnibacterium flavum TaxID=2173173 RepID=A0A2V1HR00_9MICO|nr:ABC transporter ATP-binding protein [Amnibacterium flavum]PVZ93400.1 heme ABC transporter ATP-binding protein [Amnibacterium flavum]